MDASLAQNDARKHLFLAHYKLAALGM